MEIQCNKGNWLANGSTVFKLLSAKPLLLESNLSILSGPHP